MRKKRIASGFCWLICRYCVRTGLWMGCCFAYSSNNTLNLYRATAMSSKTPAPVYFCSQVPSICNACFSQYILWAHYKPGRKRGYIWSLIRRYYDLPGSDRLYTRRERGGLVGATERSDRGAAYTVYLAYTTLSTRRSPCSGLSAGSLVALCRLHPIGFAGAP